MATLPNHSYLCYRAVSLFHSLGTCEFREFAANSAFTVRTRYCQLSNSKELRLRALKFHHLSNHSLRPQQSASSTIRARFPSPSSFHSPTASQPLVSEVKFLSRLPIPCKARPKYLSSIRFLKSPSFFPFTKVSPSFAATFTTTIQPKSSSYQPPSVSLNSKISSKMGTLPPAQKHPSVAEAMDSSPDISDVSTVPTPASTPEDFQTVLAQYNMTSQDLTEVRYELVSVARAAGDMMLNADLSTCTKSDTKNNSSDRVTETGEHLSRILYHQS